MSFITKLTCSLNLLKLNNYTQYSSALIRNIATTSGRYSDEPEKPKNINPNQKNLDESEIDRTKIIPVETSIRYLKSSAYKETYGEEAVWVPYKRNYKGLFPPRKTRKTCIRSGKISTGNPCPVCRDEYLVLHEENTGLLNQFISQQTGKVISSSKTGLCQKKHLQLLVSVERAKDRGLLTYDVPFRDYSEYYDEYKSKQ